MSDSIKHECGIAVVRLLKPLQYYADKYGTPLYGLNKLQLLLQKQRNRGQDGAGMATVKLNPPPGTRYISRKRMITTDYLKDLFDHVYGHFNKLSPEQMQDPQWLKANVPYTGELLLGHLRYGTHGVNTIETCHPFLRQNNWINRNLIVAGNFNMTNVDELFEELVQLGQYPKEMSDTVTVLEKLGHFLDDYVEHLFKQFKAEGYDNRDINKLIIKNLEIAHMLRRATKKFDGGYVIAGLMGHGDAFVVRDQHGIRPAFYYHDDEIAVVASERPAIQTAMNVPISEVRELKPGHAFIMRLNGQVGEHRISEPAEPKRCSFERIYFSRGNDRDIYLERKRLGSQLTHPVLEAVDYDFENTVFSYVPNTAESAYRGLTQGVEFALDEQKLQKIEKIARDENYADNLRKVLAMRARNELIVVKDAKLRTFIADNASRSALVSHVYDVTYGIVNDEKDNLVLLDDSIVRGTTLRDSIIYITSRLRPKRIVIVSSAPQIRYPDCYGIDMSKMKEFVAFRALVSLLDEHNMHYKLDETYEKCLHQLTLPKAEITNPLKELYEIFSYEQISVKIAELICPSDIDIEVKVIYQTVEGLHNACPSHTGDWYFTGNYPTPGGMRVVNRAFVNYMEKKDKRAYV